jgi:hypothetical protein
VLSLNILLQLSVGQVFANFSDSSDSKNKKFFFLRMNVDKRDSLIHFLSRLFGSKEINEYLCAV